MGFNLFLLTYSQLNCILDIRRNTYIDLMESVIKHIVNVGLGKIKTHTKGDQWEPVITKSTTFKYNKDKPRTKTFKNTLSNIKKTKKYKAT